MRYLWYSISEWGSGERERLRALESVEKSVEMMNALKIARTSIRAGRINHNHLLAAAVVSAICGIGKSVQ